jgi:hypothetical protein
LGAFEAHYGVDPEGRIREILFGGDFISNHASVEELERGLVGCPLGPEALHARVTAVYSRPENFLLGIGPLETVTDTILKGLPT